MKKIIIAIDGYSACGKSTLAKQLAQELGYLFLDTGAMYRAVSLYCIQNTVDWNDAQTINAALKHIEIQFIYNAEMRRYNTLLNGMVVDEAIRSMAVSNIVSEVAAISSIRKFLVNRQQEIGRQKGIVMDGRDIGTVVFPEAELKLFIKADMPVRIQRRLEELQKAGIFVTAQEVEVNLLKRDYEETTRLDSPLVMAPDAILLDNTYLNPEEQLEIALAFAREKMQ